MKGPLNYQIQRLMLPGLKRWIVIVLAGMFVVVFGFLLLLGYHPITVMGNFLRDILEHAADVLPYRISGFFAIALGAFVIFLAIARIILYIVGSYLPEDRESIPDVLFRRHQLESAPRVCVIGGGNGLSNLLRGLKFYTNNITAIVTVGDDGGSSGRLRHELGVLPPGDIRNCITALADEDKLVTELFRYRFQSGEGLEGHSFGNLFLTALWSITNGDMLEATRVASRVLNSCGQVLPSSLTEITLVAELEDGRKVVGESQIRAAGGKVKKIQCLPAHPEPTPSAIDAILHADLIILGPGSLYTSVIPNLLINGIVDAIKQAKGRKIYICNVMTEPGETDDFAVSDHVRELLSAAGVPTQDARKFIDAVMANETIPPGPNPLNPASKPVSYDPERMRELNVRTVLRPILSSSTQSQHDANLLAQAVMMWFLRRRKRRKGQSTKSRTNTPQLAGVGATQDTKREELSIDNVSA